MLWLKHSFMKINWAFNGVLLKRGCHANVTGLMYKLQTRRCVSVLVHSRLWPRTLHRGDLKMLSLVPTNFLGMRVVQPRNPCMYGVRWQSGAVVAGSG
jgi:hypothetical protein